MPQFASTIKHVQEGVKGFTISVAVKNIEGWEATLNEMDTPGAKGIVRDLERLKKLLQADTINGESVKELVGKLGKATVTLAGKAESKNAEKAKQLGEALAKAAA
ncbi:hypothetical protein [Plastoroseomonas arctica]|uniref:Uncharacterized protein n=1 Tax=Plastoroseomonas arctica TaxID=1509237 RepID=A0AAF1K0E4_9PROT|nr:hypothetical protein [Plastoroseomonas arctica]MBR0654813.1 hypothetical protein [Plastoroseomonas arctica]